MPIAEVLCVGALTHDLLPGQRGTPALGPRTPDAGARWMPGGAVLYAGFAVAAAGAKPHLVTTCDRAFEAPEPARDWAGVWQISESCARFENVETASGRRQRVWSAGARLSTSLADQAWCRMAVGGTGADVAGGRAASGEAPSATGVTPWILLAPVLAELDYQPWLEWAAARNARIALAPQGWLRAAASAGWPSWLTPKPWCALPARARCGPALASDRALVDVISLSEQELEQAGLFDQLLLATRILVVTRGARGASLYCEGRELWVPAATVVALDTTGAGDAFAGGLVARLAQGASLEQSAAFASAAAALTTERVGAHALDAARVRELADGVRWVYVAPCDAKPQPPA